jgi:hypothetical protein
MKNEERLIDCLNKLFQIRPITYGEWNKLIRFPDKEDDLLNLEKEYPELGLAGENNKSISLISIMATITDFLCKKRFAVIIDSDEETNIPLKNRVIKGVSLVDFRSEK